VRARRTHSQGSSSALSFGLRVWGLSHLWHRDAGVGTVSGAQALGDARDASSWGMGSWRSSSVPGEAGWGQLSSAWRHPRHVRSWGLLGALPAVVLTRRPSERGAGALCQVDSGLTAELVTPHLRKVLGIGDGDGTRVSGWF
jgi:hypothetical protein